MENTTGFQLDRDMGKQHFFDFFLSVPNFYPKIHLELSVSGGGRNKSTP